MKSPDIYPPFYRNNPSIRQIRQSSPQGLRGLMLKTVMVGRIRDRSKPMILFIDFVYSLFYRIMEDQHCECLDDIPDFMSYKHGLSLC